MGCLCGCGGDNLHCLRPDRPPSPNTFYENFWAPNFAHMLKSRLASARMKLEPSKRIWWREEFGGCAPDREPLMSEIWGPGGDDRGNVLRTSPPPFSDDTYASRSRNEDRNQSPPKRRRSTSPLNTSIRSPDEGAITSLKGFTSGLHRGSNGALPYLSGKALTTGFATYGTNPTLSRHSFTRTPEPPSKAKPLQSPTHPISNKFIPSKVPDSSLRHQPHTKIESPPEWEHKMFRRPLEAGKMRENRRLGMSKDQCVNVADGYPASTADDFFTRKSGDQSAKRITDDWTKTENLSRSLWRAPAVRAKLKTPKSPTHYIPDKLPPLRIPDFSKRRSVHPKRKEFTAKEDEQLRQSGLRKLEALELEIQHRLCGKPLERSKALSSESHFSTSPGEHAAEAPSNIQVKEKNPAAEELQNSKQRPFHHKRKEFTAKEDEQFLNLGLRKLEAIHRLYGIPLDRGKILAAEKLPSSPNHHVEAVSSTLQAKEMTNTAEDIIQMKQSLYEKIEAMRLRRNRRHGIAIYQHKDVVADGSTSTSHDDQAEELPSNIQAEEKTDTVEDIIQVKQSLYEKIEAMKLRRSRRHGAAIYQHREAATEGSSSTSHSDHVEEVPPNMQVVNKRLTAEEYQRWRQLLYKEIEAMKLRRNRRHGTTIYRSDAAAESSPSTSHGDHIEESSSDTQVIENENSTEEYRRWRQSLYQKIEAMKLRRNRRQGIAIRQHQDAAAKSPPSTFQVDHLAEVASMTLPTSAV